MIGLSVEDVEKPNMSLLKQQQRRKNKEKPSGRKIPRKQDFIEFAMLIVLQ
jgi:hypothetical protein